MSDEITKCPTCGSACRVAGEETRYFIPCGDEEIADLRAQLAARDAEIAAMRTVVESSLGLLHGDSNNDLSEAWIFACEEYESKVTK